MKFECRSLPPAVALTALWVLATLFLGGVAGPFGRVYLPLAALLAGAAILRRRPEDGNSGAPLRRPEGLALLGALGLLALPLWQLVAWPARLLAIQAPLAHELTFGTLERLGLPAAGRRFPISLDPAATAAALGEALAFALLAAVSLHLLRKHEIRKGLAFFIPAFAAAVAFFGTLHRFSGSPKMFWWFERGWTFFGPYVSRNHAGALFATAGAVAMGLMDRRQSRAGRAWMALCFALLCLGLLFTGSRAAVLALTAALLVRLLVWRGPRSRSLSRYAVAAGIVAVAAAAAWQADFFTRVFSPARPLAATAHLRPAFRAFAWQLWEESPWFGIGLGAFSKMSPMLVRDRFWLHPEHAENDYLELLAATGLAGAALGLLLLALLCRALWRLLRDREGSTTKKAMALGILALAVNALFVFNAPLPAHQILLALLLGGALGTHRHDPFARRPVRLLTLGAALAALAWGFWAMRPEARAPAAPAGESPPTAGATEATRFSPVNARAEALLRKAEAEDRIARHPLDAEALYRFAISAVRLGRTAQAFAAIGAAERLDPFSVPMRVAFTLASGRAAPVRTLERIHRLSDSALPISPERRSDLLLLAAQLEIRKGDFHAAQSHLERAEKITPSSWRIPLLRSAGSDEPTRDLAASWSLARAQSVTEASWDSSLAWILRKRRPSPDLNQLASVLAPHRPDIGALLARLNRLQAPGEPPVVWTLDAGLPSPRLKPNTGVSAGNARWLTPEGAREGAEEIEIRVRSVQADLDAYLLPTDLAASPDGLTVRLSLQVASGRRAAPRMVVQLGDRFVVSEEPPRRLPDGRLEFTMANIGKRASGAGRPPPRIRGIGFTPLERDGRYLVGPIELFVPRRPIP